MNDDDIYYNKYNSNSNNETIFIDIKRICDKCK